MTSRSKRSTAATRRRPARSPSRALATSREVARLAGVSRSAVSRAFTPDASVAPDTRRKVLAAAHKLGYRPNVIARSLITRKSRLIGLIMSEWENPFYTTMLRGFTEKLGARDYRLMLLACRSAADVDAAVRMLMQYRVDGIVLVSALPRESVAREFAAAGGRLVLVNRDAGRLPATSILCGDAAIGERVAEALLEAGYERFALVRGDPQARSAAARSQGFRDRLAALGRGRVLIERTGLLGYAAGRSLARELLALPSPPDAIVCSADLTAIGVLDGARIDRGVAVPGALGVVGFGDIPAADWASYELTTVRLPVERMVDACIEALLAERPDEVHRRVVVGADVVPRSTTRLLRPNGPPAGKRRP